MKSDDVIDLLKNAKVEEALEAIDKVEDRKEMASKLTEFAAALNYLKGLPVLTEALLVKSCFLDGENPYTFYNFGVLYTSPNSPDRRGRNEELAEQAYKKALALKPDFHEARYNLALLYFFTGRPELASFKELGAAGCVKGTRGRAAFHCLPPRQRPRVRRLLDWRNRS